MKILRRIMMALPLAVGCGDGAPEAEPAAAPPATLLAAADQFYTRNGVKLRYRETGQGDPLILVHGYGGRIEAWGGLADSLATRFRVVVLDVRGFGGSDTPDSAVSYGREMTADVIGLLDHLGLARAHLVGHSMGALISADAAEHYPDRVTSVTLIGGPFFPDSVTMAGALQPYVRDMREGRGLVAFIKYVFPGVPDSLAVGISAELARANDSLALIDVMAAMPGVVVDSLAGRTVRAPALVAVGTLDPLLSYSRWLTAWWPGARLLEVAGADHLNILTRPELIAGIRELAGGK